MAFDIFDIGGEAENFPASITDLYNGNDAGPMIAAAHNYYNDLHPGWSRIVDPFFEGPFPLAIYGAYALPVPDTGADWFCNLLKQFFNDGAYVKFFQAFQTGVLTHEVYTKWYELGWNGGCADLAEQTYRTSQDNPNFGIVYNAESGKRQVHYANPTTHPANIPDLWKDITFDGNGPDSLEIHALHTSTFEHTYLQGWDGQQIYDIEATILYTEYYETSIARGTFVSNVPTYLVNAFTPLSTSLIPVIAGFGLLNLLQAGDAPSTRRPKR